MIKPLTSLRFVFAIMVFASHLGYIKTENELFLNLYKYFFAEGYVGVSFFFVLSGFVISLNYKTGIIRKTILVKEYLKGRMARIYPLHAVTLLLAFPLTIPVLQADVGSWLLMLLSNMLLLQSFVPVPGYFFSFNAPSWSISCELFFYLMFPLLVRLLYKGKFWVYCSLLFILLIPAGICFFPSDLVHRFFYINPLFRLADFLLGMLLYQLYETNSLARFFRTRAAATAMEAGAVGVFVLFFAFHLLVPQGYRYASYYWLPISLLLLAFAHQKGIFSELLSGRVLVLLGERSYGFYLLHLLIMRYMLFINNKLQLLENDILVAFLIFLAVTASSFLSFRWIETPALRYLKSRKSF